MNSRFNSAVFTDSWYETVPDGYSFVAAYRRRKRRQDRRRNLRAFCAALIVVAIIVTNAVYAASDNEKAGDSRAYFEICVQSGDTLWSLAKEYCEARDIRAAVRDIAEFNQIEIGGLFIGQTIKIPQ
ncbi:MAG: LysM peptidoglycan-binding domain-containing protein [Clostridia bacterium]|nr:LysM peptidoglycan-binding domain-containing protein [Clostridia bacterium]